MASCHPSLRSTWLENVWKTFSKYKVVCWPGLTVSEWWAVPLFCPGLTVSEWWVPLFFFSWPYGVRMVSCSIILSWPDCLRVMSSFIFFLMALLCQNDELFHYFVMTSPCQNGGTFTNLWNYLSVYIEVQWYFHQSVNHLDAYINFRYIGTFTNLLIIYLFIVIQQQTKFKACLFGTSADSHLAGASCSADLHPVIWLSFCWFQCAQVADGMAFLHSTKPPIIHRDLRCGNLFLSDDDVVKVCMHVRCLASTDDMIFVCVFQHLV